jgi:alkylation response protein AidB-like acyl-CoA dehydrogenase
MKGEMDLMGPAMAVAQELTGIPDFGPGPSDVFEEHLGYVRNLKKAILMVAGSAAQKLMMTLAKEQEILMSIADMAIWVYTLESTVLRVQKLSGMRDDVALQTDMMKVYAYEAAEWIHASGKEALLAFADGDELKMMLMGLKRFCKTADFNTKEARQRIALHLIEKNEYDF